MRLHLFVLVLVSALVVLVVACGGDDDGGDGAPTATDSPTATAADGDGEPDGDADGDGDGDGDGNGDSGFTEEFGMAEAGSGGSGTIVLGGETLEYDIIVCSAVDDVYTMSGRGFDGDGEPFVAEVGVTFGFEATAEVSMGSSSVSDDGDPHWTAEPALNYQFGSNGRLILNYETTFTDGAGNEAEGSVDVNCGP